MRSLMPCEATPGGHGVRQKKGSSPPLSGWTPRALLFKPRSFRVRSQSVSFLLDRSEDETMKTFRLATTFFVLGALAALLAVGCADQPRPVNSAQNQTAAQSSPGAASSPGAVSKGDGGGGGW